MNNSQSMSSVNQIIEVIRSKKIAHLNVQDEILDQNHLKIDDNLLVNFGSCSYLGLEFDDRLRAAAIKGVENFGTQFSSSRAYVSITPYEKLEQNLEKLFGNPTILTPTTTLGHMSAIPVLVDAKDVVIMDHQVHTSIQNAVKLVKADGVHVELIRHNRMDLLEEKIKTLSDSYNNIWYMADGVYSMFGDFAPVFEIEELLNKYPNFHVYIDDAHGMSCYGDKGQGYILSQINQHERMVIATSFAKAFATGGGAIVFPTREMAQKVRNCGSTLITSGPMQPAALSAAIACSEIHLSDEIKDLQSDLHENIKYTKLLIDKFNLPDLSEPESPIFFVGVGLPKVGYNLVSRMKSSGHLVNIGIFPAVPMKNTGVRFTITRLHTFQQIEKMIADLSYHYELALNEEEYTIGQVYRAFKITPKENVEIENQIQEIISPQDLQIHHTKSIIDVPKEDWDLTSGRNGICTWNGLNVLEQSFKNNKNPQDNWSFDYVVIKDPSGKIILSTFLTSGIAKDDMLAKTELSRDIEIIRNENEYFYTSTFLCVGSMISEGNHLFIDEKSNYFKSAIKLFFEKMEELQQLYKATTLLIRDLPNDNKIMDDIMVDNGFFKTEMPENFAVDISNWDINENYKTILSKRSKRHFKENVERYEHLFKIKHILKPTNNEIDQVYSLYANVFDKSLEINTFKLPKSFFNTAAKNENWEILELSLLEQQTDVPVGAILLHKGIDSVTGVVVGLDYDLNYEFNVYRQSIYQLIKRSKTLGYSTVNFGFSAGTEKKKFGAVGHESCAYMQVKDNFKFESLMAGSFRKEARHEVAQLD